MTFTYGDRPGKSGTSTATATTDATLTTAVPVCVRIAHAGVTVDPAEAVLPVAAPKPVEIIGLASSSGNFF